MWEWKACGAGRYFWHGEALFVQSFWDCDLLARSVQHRDERFGGIIASVPEIFAKDILIFLPNVGKDSEWAAIRAGLHNHFLNTGLKEYKNRISQLQTRLRDGCCWGLASALTSSQICPSRCALRNPCHRNHILFPEAQVKTFPTLSAF